MANVTGQEYMAKSLHSHAYGNGWVESYYATVAANTADIVFFGVIPAGTEVDLFTLILGTNAASVTAKIGYAPMVAADGPTAVDDYWIAAGQALTTAAVVQSKAMPILFSKDVRIIMTIAGANLTAVKNSVVIVGKTVGVR